MACILASLNVSKEERRKKRRGITGGKQAACML
jgi:hypothetical protein